jgi:bisphosphoglycerate-independent phosphoglycerate mutase (AlkP superfamily)
MMGTNTKDSFPFDARNQQDFMLVTKRIQHALEQMANDCRLKRTETNLAKLAGCSRGTLRNRQWPMEQLQKLKQDARMAQEQIEVEPRATREKAQVVRYRDKLMKNRDELLFWKYKHDTLRDLVETLESQRDIYKRRAEALEAQLRSVAISSNFRKPQGNIVPFSPTKPVPDSEPDK